MDLQKFKSLSLKQQKEILGEYSKIMNDNAELTPNGAKTPPPSLATTSKRELQSPETPPHVAGRKKVLFQLSFFLGLILFEGPEG